MSQTPIYDLPRFQVQCECLNNLVVEVKGLARYISHKDYLASRSTMPCQFPHEGNECCCTNPPVEGNRVTSIFADVDRVVDQDNNSNNNTEIQNSVAPNTTAQEVDEEADQRFGDALFHLLLAGTERGDLRTELFSKMALKGPFGSFRINPEARKAMDGNEFLPALAVWCKTSGISNVRYAWLCQILLRIKTEGVEVLDKLPHDVYSLDEYHPESSIRDTTS